MYVMTCSVLCSSYLIAWSAENNDLESDLLSLIKHVHRRMMSIESDIVKLD